MSETVKTLIEMGFSQQKAEIAVNRSGATQIADVMDWLLSHEEELDSTLANAENKSEERQSDVPSQNIASEPDRTEVRNDEPNASSSSDNVDASKNIESEVPSAEQAVAKSFQCDECGKLFKNSLEVEYHATKSGHGNFSESTEEKKPLTEEEKKEQLAKIEAKLKQRRLEREAREKEEALIREKNRIKSGKELLEAKKKQDALELKKIIDQRKRQKEEERIAKEIVRQQIEQDKLARKQKYGQETANTEQNVTQPAVAVPQSRPTANYREVKLKIQLPNGQILTQTFGAKEPLAAVKLYVEMNRSDGDGPFRLMTTFPRKVFSDEDFDKPLDTLGLAPTATLVISKC